MLLCALSVISVFSAFRIPALPAGGFWEGGGRFARPRKPFGIGADCCRNPGAGPRVRPRTSSRRPGRALPRAFGAAPCLTDTEAPLRGDTELHEILRE